MLARAFICSQCGGCCDFVDGKSGGGCKRRAMHAGIGHGPRLRSEVAPASDFAPSRRSPEDDFPQNQHSRGSMQSPVWRLLFNERTQLEQKFVCGKCISRAGCPANGAVPHRQRRQVQMSTSSLPHVQQDARHLQRRRTTAREKCQPRWSNTAAACDLPLHW